MTELEDLTVRRIVPVASYQSVTLSVLIVGLFCAILAGLFFIQGLVAPADPAIIQAGFYTQEHNQGFTYRLSQPQSSILVHGSGEPYMLRFRVRSPDPLPPRTLVISHQETLLATVEARAVPQNVMLLMPVEERPGIGSLVELITTGVSTPDDSRALGLMYDQVSAMSLNAPMRVGLGWLWLTGAILVATCITLYLRKLLTVKGRMHLMAGLLLGGIVTVFFAPILFTGQVLSASDMIFTTAAFSQYAPEGFTRASNPILSDQPYQFIPWRYIAWQALREGRLPLWDLHSLAGRPFLATQQAAFFYPLNVSLTMLPFQDTFLWSAMLRLWVAGFGTWLLARHYRLSVTAALLAASSFMLCGFLIVWLGHPHTNVAIWLPWLILLSDRLLHAEKRTHIVRETAFLALVVGIQFTGGHIQTSVDIFVALGLYVLLRWWTMPRPHIIRRFLPLMVASGLGTGLAAIHLVSFLEWLPYSEVLRDRSSHSFVWIRPDVVPDTMSLALLLYPNLYNNPTWPFPGYYNPNSFSNYNESVWYVGVLGLTLALAGVIVLIRREPLVRIWLIICLVAMGRALQWPVFDWFNQLPGLGLAVPARNRLVAQLCLCILAGFGVQALCHQSGMMRQRTRVVATVGFSSIILTGIVIALFGRYWSSLWGDNLPLHLQIDNIAMYVPMFIAIGGLVLLWRGRGSRVISTGFIALVVIDLILFGQGYNPSVSPAYFYPTTAALRRIQSDPGLFRFSAPHIDLVPDAQTMYGLMDIRGLDFRTTWYTQYVNLIPGRGGSLYYTGFTNLNTPLARVLNIKYILSREADDYVNDPLLRHIGPIDGMHLWEVRDPAPRAILTQRVILARDHNEAADRLRHNSHIPFSEVILLATEQPPLFETDSYSVSSEIKLLDYASETSIWRVTIDRPAYLVIQDAYYPGWKAMIDDHLVPIYRANVSFRAIYVPAGEHTISLSYRPWWIPVGAITSTFSLLLIGLLFAMNRIRK